METLALRTQRVDHGVTQSDVFQVELWITAAAPVAVKPWAHMGQQRPSFRRTYYRWSAPKHCVDRICAVGQRLVLQRGDRNLDDQWCVPMVTGQYCLVRVCWTTSKKVLGPNPNGCTLLVVIPEQEVKMCENAKCHECLYFCSYFM